MELRIPPLLLALLIGAVAYGVHAVSSGLAHDFPGRVWLALALAGAGIAVAMAGVIEFRRARTTVDPRNPAASSSIVTSGIYRMTRNPMYLGFLLWLVAWAVYLGNPLALAGPVAFVVYMNRFQIGPEERILARQRRERECLE